jgi:hypothetical protein
VRSLTSLKTINNKPAADFRTEADGKRRWSEPRTRRTIERSQWIN